jgi:FKBP-type peptidyl-prolyl cis-trans isomerase SlyD
VPKQNRVKYRLPGYGIAGTTTRSEMSDMTVVQDGQVVSIEYILTVGDQVLDTSAEEGPLEFLQGSGNIVPGLEREMYGMKIGDSKQVVVSPKDGYGEFDDGAFMDVPRAEFPAEIPLEHGIELNVTDEDGKNTMAYIDTVGDQSVRLDFNHPLAGTELHFDVKVVGLRPATPEELEHGHAHSHEHAHGHDHGHDHH